MSGASGDGVDAVLDRLLDAIPATRTGRAVDDEGEGPVEWSPL